jgi:hypothetical protein
MDLLSGRASDWGRIRQASLAASRTIDDTGCTSESPGHEPCRELAIDRLLGVHDRSRSLLLNNDYRRRVSALDHYRVSGERLLDLWLLAHSNGGCHPSVLLAAKSRLGLLRLLLLLLGLLVLLVVVFLLLSVDRLLR